VTTRASLKASILLATLAWPVTAVPQDAHYWTYGYGPIGQLAEGTLVGGVEELSAVYYNPGALALINRPRFVIGLNSIELAEIKVPGAAGERLDFDQTIFDVVPAMVAGHVGENRGQADHFAVAFLSRHDSDWDLAYSDVRVSGAAPDGSAGFGRARQRLVEYWVGGSWSHRLSVGLSPFFAYRAQRSRRALTLEELAGDTSRAVFVGRENEYNHLRLMAKAGVAWRPGRWAGARLAASCATASASSSAWGTASSSMAARRTTSPPTSPSATASPRGT
jgi:hypothetical protein